MDGTYQILIVGTLLLGLLPAVVLGSRGLKLGLLVWIGTLALGYRTFGVTKQVLIHPAEVVIYGLCLWLGLQRLSKRGTSGKPWVPLWLWPFALTWVLGWWPLVYGDVKPGAMLSEFKNVFLILPLFVVASVVMKDQMSWRPVVFVFYCVGLWIASVGILEYAFPELKTWFPNFITNPAHIEEEGFQRAAFSFWGSPDAVYLCLLALPFSLVIWNWWRASWARVITVLATAVLLYAIYLSGHRNAWLTVVLQLSLILILKKRLFVLALLAVVFVFWGYQQLPNQARVRISSGAHLIAGRPLEDDSSGQGRWTRITASWNNINDRPLGGGWASAGWVHNDFFQLAENLGLAVGLFFLGAYLFTLQRMLRQLWAVFRSPDPPWLMLVVFLSYIAAGIVFATDANLALTQHIAPIWFIWVMAELLLRQTRQERHSIIDAYRSLGATAHLQLRHAGGAHIGIGEVGR